MHEKSDGMVTTYVVLGFSQITFKSSDRIFTNKIK